MNEHVKACCQNEANLVAQPQTRPDLVVRICDVCGRRHFEATVDPGRLGLRLAAK
jgi:hypothetical protein